jgi:hypothetical protein
MTPSHHIDALVRLRDERRTKGTDITETENAIVEAIRASAPVRKVERK